MSQTDDTGADQPDDTGADQPDGVAKLTADIDAAREEERECVREINVLGAADTDSKRDSPTADKIRDLDTRRKAAVDRRRQLTAERAMLTGALATLSRRGQAGKSVRAILQAGIKSLHKQGGGR